MRQKRAAFRSVARAGGDIALERHLRFIAVHATDWRAVRVRERPTVSPLGRATISGVTVFFPYRRPIDGGPPMRSIAQH